MKKKSFLHSISFKVLLILIILVLPLNVIAIAETNAAINTTVEQVRLAKQNLGNIYMQELDNRMNSSISLLFYFSNRDSNCIQMKRQDEDGYQYDSARLKFYANLKQMADLIDGGDGYYFYMKNKEDLLIYGTVTGGRNVINEISNDIPEMTVESGEKGWHIWDWEGRQYLLLIVDEKDVMYGSWMDLETVKEQMKSGIGDKDSEIYFQDKQGEVAGKNQLLISAEARNIYLNIYLNRNTILNDISPYQRFLFSMVVIYLILVPLLYIFLNILLLKPLKKINEAHRQLQEGQQEYRIVDKAGSTEYEEAFESFNQMADNLAALKIEAYEKEINRQKMELRNLQLQIRPHFLLNTFNLIYTLAQKKDITFVQETILYLSGYFRYIFRSGKDLELFDKELEMIRGYLRVANVRYRDRIQSEFEIDDEIRLVRTPPLLIHNFVENAVKYGTKKAEVLHIRIQALYKEGWVTFCIRDDGMGMSEEILERNRKILNGEIDLERQTEHVGLYNSIKRLKFFYGGQADIQVNSIKGEGTEFIIHFPYKMEVEDEFIDRER